MSRADKIREAFAQSHGAHWHATDAYSRAVWLGVGLVVAGMFLHQVEMVLFGVPLVLSVLLTHKPHGKPTVSVRPVPRGAGAGVVHTVAQVDGADAEIAVIKLPGGVKAVPAHSPDLPVEIRRDAWGPGVDLRLDHLFAGPDGMHVYGPIVGVEHVRTILPPVEHHPSGPLPPRPAGLVGIHRSPRAGCGASRARTCASSATTARCSSGRGSPSRRSITSRRGRSPATTARSGRRRAGAS